MSSIGMGVKVFSRTNKLENLLESVDPSVIETVHVADDGKSTSRKEELYSREFPFELNVIDLDYDTGLGYGRKRIVEESTEDFLLIVDSDHIIPHNVELLRKQLEHDPELGGISGALIENNRVRIGAHDLYTEGNLLIRDIRNEKEIRRIAGAPFVEFDFIPNVALFRRQCVEDYCWDEKYKIGTEHIDFYVGHFRNTDWTFGCCPEVYFQHKPGGDRDYKSSRRNYDILRESHQYFLDKWGYDQVFHVRGHWIDSYRPGVHPIRTLLRLLVRASTFAPYPILKIIANAKYEIQNG